MKTYSAKASRDRKEVGADRRQGPGRRPPCLDHRDAAARQAQADLHPPYGLRRQRHRHQCRPRWCSPAASARRRSITTTPATSGGIKERTAKSILEGRFPGARRREGGGAHGAARSARPQADAQSARLSRAPSIRTRRSSPKCSTSAPMNPKNVRRPDPMAETLNSLQDLGEPAAGRCRSAAPRPEARRHGRAYATGKRKNAVARVWIKPGTGKITGQCQRGSRPLSPARCCACDPAAAGRRQPRRPVRRHRHRRRAAGCPARPAPCVTASPRR